MISRELAEKLKNAGLAWEPKILDSFYNEQYNVPFYVWYIDNGMVVVKVPVIKATGWSGSHQESFEIDDCVFAPRLDQLLAEIEKRGWLVELSNPDRRWRMLLWQRETHLTEMNEYSEDAAAKALLWILEQKGA